MRAVKVLANRQMRLTAFREDGLEVERPGIVDGCFDATLSQLIPKLFTPLFHLFSGKENRVLVIGVLHPSLLPRSVARARG